MWLVYVDWVSHLVYLVHHEHKDHANKYINYIEETLQQAPLWSEIPMVIAINIINIHHLMSNNNVLLPSPCVVH
jgi:hypothetical protein